MKPFRAKGEAGGYQSERLRMFVRSIGSYTVSIAAATTSAKATAASNLLRFMLISLSSEGAGVNTQAFHAIEQGAARQP
jgi:hypothetical protein